VLVVDRAVDPLLKPNLVERQFVKHQLELQAEVDAVVVVAVVVVAVVVVAVVAILRSPSTSQQVAVEAVTAVAVVAVVVEAAKTHDQSVEVGKMLDTVKTVNTVPA